MKTITRRIISRKQWDSLIEKGMVELTETKFGKDYAITIREEVDSHYTPDTVGKIEEKDYHLTSITCTLDMCSVYIKEEPHDVTVDDDENPYEYSNRFYIPEWMFEDRQNDLEALYRKYGR